MFRFRHLYRMRSHIGKHMRVAVESICPRPCAPSATCEVDINEWLAIGVIAANRNAGVAAISSSLYFIRQHHRKGAEHAINHAKTGKSTCGASRRQYSVADGSGWTDDLYRSKHAFVVGNTLWKYRSHACVRSRFGKRESVIDGTSNLWRGAGPVYDNVSAFFCDTYKQANGLAVIDAIVINPILEAPLSVG